MDLSDSEKRDLIKLIESNKPLPDQYRFRLFEKSDEIELLWNGKSNEITNVNLPFQIIEYVDEPRKNIKPELQGDLFDERGRKLKGANKLIWGNNSLVLSSLINGNLRSWIEEQGGLKLVYIDPPFNVGDDFEIEINFGKEKLSKKRNALEQIAYSDTWGKGSDSFLSMIYERLILIKNLLASDGSIFVHCDWRLNSQIKLILDEIFDSKYFRNEVIWYYSTLGRPNDRFAKKHDTIFYYGKSDNTFFNSEEAKIPYTQDYINSHFRDKDEKGRQCRKRFDAGKWRVYYPEDGMIPNDVWEIPYENSMSKFRTGYPTQKPEKLLERIIKSASKENDLIADFFCGSGTTLAVAEKLNRKWIGCDLGKFAIHTSRKRLIQIQRDKEMNGEHFRPFEVLNLGKYQREFFFKDYLFKERNIKNEQSEAHYYDLILKAYKAKKETNFITMQGTKNNRAVAIGPFNLQVTRMLVEAVINECLQQKILAVDILGFEFEMGLFPNVRDVAAKQGVDLNCLYIPNDIFDKRAVKKHQIIFYNTAFIDAQIITKKDEFCIKLKGYIVFDSDTLFDEALSELDKGEKREILMKNSIIKVEKDKNGKIKKQIIKMNWSDWVDYWSVDFDFENKKEIIKDGDKDKWTGDFIFENEWQSFTTRDSEIEFETPFRKIVKGKKIAVKVVDIFGNDTMKILQL
jgi:DNA modification methylase